MRHAAPPKVLRRLRDHKEYEKGRCRVQVQVQVHVQRRAVALGGAGLTDSSVGGELSLTPTPFSTHALSLPLLRHAHGDGGALSQL
eukprot:scaffold259028_cov26-Tisochrysis_lutea.AAC.1